MGRVLRHRKAVTYNEHMLELENGMGAISEDEFGQPRKRHKAAVRSADVAMADSAEPASRISRCIRCKTKEFLAALNQALRPSRQCLTLCACTWGHQQRKAAEDPIVCLC